MRETVLRQNSPINGPKKAMPLKNMGGCDGTKKEGEVQSFLVEKNLVRKGHDQREGEKEHTRFCRVLRAAQVRGPGETGRGIKRYGYRKKGKEKGSGEGKKRGSARKDGEEKNGGCTRYEGSGALGGRGEKSQHVHWGEEKRRAKQKGRERSNVAA